MKKNYFLFALLIAASFAVNAQNTVVVDASAEIIGYANVFETPANGGAFVFGDSWGVPDLKTVVNPGDNTITLQPNFNTYGDGSDPFWVDQGTGEGNKVFEGNTFVEDVSLAGEALTFSGGVQANTLDAGYTVVAFIKVFNVDFSVLKEETSALVAGQNFSVVFTDVAPEDVTVQYGFKVIGVNANPADEGALGSVVVTDDVLSINDNNLVDVSIYPNPSGTNWNVAVSNDVIQTIEVFNILGSQVSTMKVNNNSAIINGDALSQGIYLARVSTSTGQKTIKLIKK
jgi:hypothetical protein